MVLWYSKVRLFLEGALLSLTCVLTITFPSGLGIEITASHKRILKRERPKVIRKQAWSEIAICTDSYVLHNLHHPFSAMMKHSAVCGVLMFRAKPKHSLHHILAAVLDCCCFYNSIILAFLLGLKMLYNRAAQQITNVSLLSQYHTLQINVESINILDL